MDELKGVGHFSFWFVQGYLVFRALLFMNKEHFKLKLYGPFIPFFMGTIAVIPFILAMLKIVSQEQIMTDGYNLFLFYGLLNHVSFIVRIFSNFHLAVILAGLVYMALLFHYIFLVKATRRIYAK